MGAFIANVQVRSEALNTVQQTAKQLVGGHFHVSAPHRGWVSVYEQRASTQDEHWIEQFAMELSSRLQTVCVAFLVHDSDIARYWLIDRGNVLDEFNSIPDYFDRVSASEKRRVHGQADVFLRYCRPGVTLQQIEAVLRADVTFAEETISQLAEFLGIDPDRALGDFNHPETGDEPGSLRNLSSDEEDYDDLIESKAVSSDRGNIMQKMQQKFAGLFSSDCDQATSPQATALVEAAAAGNVGEIERLVEEVGTVVNSKGLLPLEAPGMSSLGGTSPAMPKVVLSPLMAAASRGQAAALLRLLELGADPREEHSLYGSALHVAAQSGSPETVRLLLAAGIPPGVKNRQGLTPRGLIQAVRKQIDMARMMVKTMPHLQKVYDQLSAKFADLPEAGWAACEELLRQAEG